MELLLVTDTALTDQILRQDPKSSISLRDIRERCATIARRVDARCAGLLEVTRHSSSTSIRFIHRSANDFLGLDEEGQKFSRARPNDKGSPQLQSHKSISRYGQPKLWHTGYFKTDPSTRVPEHFHAFAALNMSGSHLLLPALPFQRHWPVHVLLSKKAGNRHRL